MMNLSTYLYPEEWGEDDVGDDDQVDLVEEAAGHQDHQDQVHDWKHPQCHPLQGSRFKDQGSRIKDQGVKIKGQDHKTYLLHLHNGVSVGDDVVDDDHRHRDGCGESTHWGHLVTIS